MYQSGYQGKIVVCLAIAALLIGILVASLVVSKNSKTVDGHSNVQVSSQSVGGDTVQVMDTDEAAKPCNGLGCLFPALNGN